VKRVVIGICLSLLIVSTVFPGRAQNAGTLQQHPPQRRCAACEPAPGGIAALVPGQHDDQLQSRLAALRRRV